MMRAVIFLFILIEVVYAGSALAQNILEEKDDQKIFAIKNVVVIPMTLGHETVTNATVVIENNRITSLNGPIPSGAEVIDGTGKWLMPGLIDMHVHVPTDTRFGDKLPTQAATMFFDTQDLVTTYVANGVTTIFELSARGEHFGQRNQIAKGDVIGPRMALAALINGGDGSGRVTHTPADGRQAVRSAKAEGYEFVKLYSALDEDSYKAIIDESHKQGLNTIGHIPDAFRNKLDEAFVPHFGMVAHAEEFSKHAIDFNESEAKRFAQLMKRNGTWLSPTLITMVKILSQTRSLNELRESRTLQYVHPLLQSKWLTANNYNKNTSPERIAYFEKLVKFHNVLVRESKAAGVPIVVGTDTGTSGLVAGFSVHDELELLVEAGLKPLEAIASATRLPSLWLNIDKLVGTIEVGKLADLVLLDANPLVNVKNTRSISGVFVDGRWLNKETIDKLLVDLATRNLKDKDVYDWKKLTR